MSNQDADRQAYRGAAFLVDFVGALMPHIALVFYLLTHGKANAFLSGFFLYALYALYYLSSFERFVIIFFFGQTLTFFNVMQG